MFFRINRLFFLKILTFSFFLFTTYYILSSSGLITHPNGNVISNAFVFFGHTDYGGDGGEGSFVYPENKARYETALAEYCESNEITSPTTININDFQRSEIKKYIINHPVKWARLQFTKFFRTFGVVPESTSFKVLYTGPLKGNLWLTSISVVAPVALIILLFILFFNLNSIRKLNGSRGTVNQQQATSNKQHFLSVYLLMFVYYLIATIFFGQYQERYRMPLMVVFIIPVLSI